MSIQEQIEGIPGQVVQGATDGITGWIGRNWLTMLLVGVFGPVLASNFRDRLPEGMGWLTNIGDFFIGLLSRLPFVGNFFGNMIQTRAEGWEAAEARENLENQMHLPPQLSQALAPSTAVWQQTARWLREEGGTSVTNPITTRSVSRMLTTPEGREIAGRLLNGIRTARAAGWNPAGQTPAAGETPEGQTPAAGQTPDFMAGLTQSLGGGNIVSQIQSTLLEVMRGPDGLTIINDPAAMAVLYDGAATLSGFTFTDGALRTFIDSSGLEAAGKRDLIVAFMQNPVQAIDRLRTDERFRGVPAEQVQTLIAAIQDPLPAGMSEADTATITRAREAARSGNLSATLQVTRDIGEERLSAFAASPIGALATYGAPDAENRLTVEDLQGLARAARLSNADVPAYVLTIMEQNGQQVLDLVGQLGAADFRRFGELLQTSAAEIPAGAENAAQLQTARSAARGQLLRFVSENPERRTQIMGFLSAIGPSLPADLSASITELSTVSPTVAANAGAALEALNLDNPTEQALYAAMRTAKNGNYTELATLLLRDDAGQVNVRNLIRTNPTVLAALANIAGELPANATYGQRASAAFLTGDGQAGTAAGAHNISALLTLIEAIDTKTGQQYVNAAGQAIAQDESQADARTARVVNFLVRLSAGQATAGELEVRGAGDTTLIEDISRRMNDINVVNAMQNFLNTADVGNMTPAQQRLFNTLKTHFFIDSNNDDRMQRREGTYNPLRLFDHSDDGLAPYLADPDHAAIVLRAMLGNNGFAGFLHGESWATQPQMVADSNLAAIREAGAAVNVERGATVRPTPVEMPGVRGGMSGNLPYGT